MRVQQLSATSPSRNTADYKILRYYSGLYHRMESVIESTCAWQSLAAALRRLLEAPPDVRRQLGATGPGVDSAVL
jgi:hypothetical protein